jgi:hypothetical protein
MTARLRLVIRRVKSVYRFMAQQGLVIGTDCMACGDYVRHLIDRDAMVGLCAPCLLDFKPKESRLWRSLTRLEIEPREVARGEVTRLLQDYEASVARYDRRRSREVQ